MFPYATDRDTRFPGLVVSAEKWNALGEPKGFEQFRKGYLLGERHTRRTGDLIFITQEKKVTHYINLNFT